MLTFISSPYSDSDPSIVEQRAWVVQQCAIWLFNAGHYPISPILIGHSIVSHVKLDEAGWINYSLVLLETCEVVWILRLPGWERSAGVNAELNKAIELGKVIKFVDYIDYTFIVLEEK